VPAFHFYQSLAYLARYKDLTETEQTESLDKVAANQTKMKKWADHAPMNYLHKYYLVEAEKARCLDDEGTARILYDKAITLAQTHGYTNEEAIACEVAGLFYLGKNIQRLAQVYLRDSHYAYQRWGAMAKVNQLEKQHPYILGKHFTATTINTASTGSITTHTLDINTILKASQTISGEIELDNLLAKLMRIVIENAGAQKGYLILKQKQGWIITAAGTIDRFDHQTFTPISLKKKREE
jgi:hypothetical protein